MVRLVMRELAPEGFDIRYPGNKHTGPHRTALDAVGPFQEVSSDGHEKLDAKALKMGSISLPFYTYREKWSGFILKLVVLPDARKAGALGHVFLDLMSEIKGAGPIFGVKTPLTQNLCVCRCSHSNDNGYGF